MSFLKSYIYLLFNRASISAISVLTALLTARLLEPEYYGALVSVIAVMSIFIRFGSMGLIQSFQHFGSKDYPFMQGYIIPLSIVFIAPFSITLLVGFNLVSILSYVYELNPLSLLVYQTLQIGLSLMLMHLCCSMYFLGSEKPIIYLLVSIVPVSFTLFFVISAFFSTDPFDLVLIGWKLQLVIGGLFSFIFIVYEIFKQRAYVNQIVPKMIEVTKYGLKSVFVSSVSFTLMRISVVIGSAFSLTEVAVFSIVRAFCEMLLLIYGSLGSTLFSAVSRDENSDHAIFLYCQTARISSFLLVLVSLLTAGAAHKVVPLLFGSDYVASVSIVYILMPAVFMATQQRLAENFLFGMSSQIIILKYQIPNLILLGMLVWWLTPLYGAAGIAIASLISALFAYISVILLINKKYQISYKSCALINGEDMHLIKLKLQQLMPSKANSN